MRLPTCFPASPAPFAARARRGLAVLALATGLLGSAGATPAKRFGLDDVDAMARCLSSSFCLRDRPPALTSEERAPIPDTWLAMDYDTFRDIRYRPDRSVWRGESPYELDLFPRGGYFPTSVQVNEITDKGVKPIAFDHSVYDYGKVSAARQSDAPAGWSGVRLFYPLNVEKQRDELIVFLGASYFRALGKGQRYGLSARGLAVDTTGGNPEEFPRFSHFWFERPKREAAPLVMYALMQSPRVNGAYRFEVKPGEETVVGVQARIYPKAGITTLGVAPLTSMFYSGENQPTDGFRPEIHDSDGLMVQTSNDEWLWRPLINAPQPLATSFGMPAGVKGFGLMQRDRNFSSYEDVEARYDLRPSAWVVPEGDWGPGRVEMLHLNAPDETHDNVVAYWVPKTLPPPGQPLEVRYQLHWQGANMQRPPVAWTVQTRAGRGFNALPPDELHYTVDFDGPRLRALAPGSVVKAVVTASDNARIVERNVYPNDATGGWRMTIHLKRLSANQPIELRAFLQLRDEALTETWTYLIPTR